MARDIGIRVSPDGLATAGYTKAVTAKAVIAAHTDARCSLCMVRVGRGVLRDCKRNGAIFSIARVVVGKMSLSEKTA